MMMKERPVTREHEHLARRAPHAFRLRIKGQTECLKTDSGVFYVNTEWGELQLKNIAGHHGVLPSDIELVQVEASALLDSSPG